MHALAAQPVSIPAALKTAVTAEIRKLVADIWYTIQLTDGGAIRIVAATMARDAAVPGVRVASGRHSPHGRIAELAELAELAEEATLSRRHPHRRRRPKAHRRHRPRPGRPLRRPVALVARQVQQRVIAEFRTTVGVQDVTVEDIVA